MTRIPDADRHDPTRTEMALDSVTSYEDGDETVICDRQEPAAWVRSADTVAVQR